MIYAEFRNIASSDAPLRFANGEKTVRLSHVPSVGEIVNIGGDPFRVIDRSWAIDADDECTVYCFLRVSQTGGC